MTTPDPDTTALLWGRRAEGTRGPRPTVSVGDVAAAAVAVADADGLAAVTMARVADRLGLTKMALYRYVRTKDELVAVMTEHALGAPPDTDDATAGWRERLHDWARQMYALFVRHPWALQTTVGARAVGPRELDWLERALRELADTGLEGAERLDVVVTVVGHVRALAEQTTASTGPASERSLNASLAALVRDHEERYPALSAALVDPGSGEDRALDFGLERILDGVARLVETRRA